MQSKLKSGQTLVNSVAGSQVEETYRQSSAQEAVLLRSSDSVSHVSQTKTNMVTRLVDSTYRGAVPLLATRV